MNPTNPVRFVVWFVFFVCGVFIGFSYFKSISGTLKTLSTEEEVKPLKTRIKGEVTEASFEERAILIEWMKFDGNDVQSVCRASEIVRKGENIFLKDPVLYDYDRTTNFVTRTSGKFGEAVLAPGESRELRKVKIWEDAMIFRYKAGSPLDPNVVGSKQEDTKGNPLTKVLGVP